MKLKKGDKIKILQDRPFNAVYLKKGTIGKIKFPTHLDYLKYYGLNININQKSILNDRFYYIIENEDNADYYGYYSDFDFYFELVDEKKESKKKAEKFLKLLCK